VAPASVHVERLADLESALLELGLAGGRPTIVVAGGAGGVAEPELDRLRPLFTQLALAAARLGAAVVDGGTDAGVMRLLGRARVEQGGSFPLVGVAARSLVVQPGTAVEGDRAPLEPNHSHVVLVPGERWGDETPWLVRVADCVAGGCPSLTLLVNGGDVALEEVAASVAAGRPVLVVAGSGRAADGVAAASSGIVAGPRARDLAASELVHVAELGDDSGHAVVDQLEEILSSGGKPRWARTRTEAG